jgi:hypothetical protein
MPNPFDQFDNHAGPVYGLPRQAPMQTSEQATGQTLQNTKNQLDIANNPLTVANTKTNIEQGQASIQNQKFNQNQGLRQEYNALPLTKNYQTVVQKMGSALNAPPGPQGDLDVLYAFATVMDPNSVVRESEQDMAKQTASLYQQLQQKYRSYLEGNGLPPEVRQGLIETMRHNTAVINNSYNQQRAQYEDLAKRNGFDPVEIVGPHLGSTMQPLEKQYIEAHGGTPRINGVPVDQPAPEGPQTNAPTQTVGQFGDARGEAPLPPHAEDFRNGLYSAMRNRQINSPADMKAWVQQFNQQNGTQYQPQLTAKDTLRAINAARKGQAFNVELPKYMPNISDVRGGENTSNQDAYNAGVRGIIDTPTLGTIDKIVAASDTLFKGGTMDENLARQYAISDYDQQKHPYARLAGQAVGGALVPMGEMASIPQAVGKSAALGAAYGAGSSRSLADVPQNAFLGGVAGGAIGGVVGGIPRALGALRRAPGEVPPLVDPQTGQLNQPLEAMTPGQRVVKAEEYGVNLPADAAGGRTAAVIGKGLDIMPGSAGVMEDARRATESQIAAASDVVASRFGNARTMNEAGSELQQAANARIERGKTVIGKAYDAIPIADQAPASTSNSVAALQTLTGRFQSNPDLAATLKDPKLAGYLDALQKGGLSWQDLKDFRSIIGEKIGEMRFGESSSTSDLRALYAGLSEDMQTTAAQMGPRATAAFNRANNLNRENEQLIQGALTRILGKDGQLSPEKAAAAVQAMTKGGKSTGDLKTLAQIRSATMKSGAWNDIAATMIRLGGQPVNSAGRDFNPQTFVNWYADMSEPARKMLFGKSELRDALDGFVAVNQRLQKVNALRNTSQTAGNLTAAGTVGTMAASIGSPLLGAKLLGVMAGNYGMAKLWTNPAFVRLITGYSKAVASGNDNAVRSQIGRIGKLATTNPDLREPLIALQRRLANDNYTPSVAASSSNQADQNQ